MGHQFESPPPEKTKEKKKEIFRKNSGERADMHAENDCADPYLVMMGRST